ncbi:MAG: F0F1 ATP synthase subunit epsilon [Hyphomicrobiales bacterium]|nr:F0F1 ATP synthase subunit epsilon [Hyphomicrobiales bacterium]
MTFKFELVSPERLLVSADVNEVIVPGAEGDFTILPLHAPFISTLRPGVLTAPNLDGKEARFFVRGGFAEAGPDALTVLAEIAIPISELTDASFASQIQLAQHDLSSAPDDEAKYAATDILERLTSLRESLRLAS